MRRYKNTTIINLQKYLPLILNNQNHFNNFSIQILEKYDFVVDEYNLRKKLQKFLDASFRTDNLSTSNRLIRGTFNDNNDINWIWLNSREVGLIATDSITTHTC